MDKLAVEAAIYRIERASSALLLVADAARNGELSNGAMIDDGITIIHESIIAQTDMLRGETELRLQEHDSRDKPNRPL